MPGLLNHVFKSEASFIKRSVGEINSAFSIRHGVYVRGQGPLTKGGGIRVTPQKMFPCIFVLFKLPVLYNIKMYISVFKLKSVQEVGFYFSACVLESGA